MVTPENHSLALSFAALLRAVVDRFEESGLQAEVAVVGLREMLHQLPVKVLGGCMAGDVMDVAEQFFARFGVALDMSQQEVGRLGAGNAKADIRKGTGIAFVPLPLEDLLPGRFRLELVAQSHARH